MDFFWIGVSDRRRRAGIGSVMAFLQTGRKFEVASRFRPACGHRGGPWGIVVVFRFDNIAVDYPVLA